MDVVEESKKVAEKVQTTTTRSTELDSKDRLLGLESISEEWSDILEECAPEFFQTPEDDDEEV